MRVLLLALALLAPAVVSAADGPPRVYLVGDSTMADKPLDLPERGWGMALGPFFTDPPMIRNHAMNGRSSKSFIAEGRWEKILAELKAGDFVIVQFGHNDEKIDDPKRGTHPQSSFPDNLRRYVREARQRRLPDPRHPGLPAKIRCGRPTRPHPRRLSRRHPPRRRRRKRPAARTRNRHGHLAPSRGQRTHEKILHVD